jgi:hypothetical protein
MKQTILRLILCEADLFAPDEADPILGCPPVRLIVFAATPIPRGCLSMKLSLNEADTLC